MTDTVAVVGASGFIGQHVLAGLRDQWRVISVSRSTPVVQGDRHYRLADAADVDGLRLALRGTTAVVYLVGRAHHLKERGAGPVNRYRDGDLAAVNALLAAIDPGSTRRLVFLSSVAAATDATVAPAGDDVLPCPATPYGISKRGAEMRLAEGVSPNVALTILRPPMVFGEGMKGNPLRLMSLVSRGVPIPTPAPAGKRSMIYVGNLVQAIRATLDGRAVDARPYFVADPVALEPGHLARVMGSALRLPARVVPVPARLVRWIGRVGDVLNHVAYFPFSSYEVGRLTGSLEVDASRFWRDAATTPEFSLEDGMRRTADWFRSTHLT